MKLQGVHGVKASLDQSSALCTLRDMKQLVHCIHATQCATNFDDLHETLHSSGLWKRSKLTVRYASAFSQQTPHSFHSDPKRPPDASPLEHL